MELNKFWKGIQEGDEKSLEGLFREINASLSVYAAYLIEDDAVAEEIVQDVFLKIWQDREKLLIKGSLKAYLYKSVKNKAINILIQNKTKKSSVNKLLSNESWQYIQETFDFNDYIIEKLEADEIMERIREIIKTLPEQCRRIILLSRFENKSNKEIAMNLRISEHTVKAHIYKAMESIKKVLD